MRVEYQHRWSKTLIDDDDNEYTVESMSEQTEEGWNPSTTFIITDRHPVDNHEFGLAVLLNGIRHKMEEFQQRTAEAALYRYIQENPDGDPNAKY